ncbi:MAG: hypothetical protein A3F13_04045 [Gammaproteobacteria bacterium RIFCSPHIGHO2_12_FULL_40_19]|nr:MAG: hypothetical protein A3F13_04045 [Gammaproteobacteria bacterium RIFCSPHIGHO2_12_FULL_40_19]
MKLYQKTGCRALLVGRLKEMPNLLMDDRGKFSTKLIIATKKSENNGELSYRVFVQGESALRIRQFGFIGLYLWIEGDFENTGEIMAEKISFLNFPGSGKIDQDYKLMNDFSYREKFELFYIPDHQNSEFVVLH